MNDIPNAQRPHIAFFGRRNAGKSSIVNRVTGQALAIVSPQAGTTTDPVYKAMELLPAGPVVIIDTPGYDDEGSLGDLRVAKTRQVLDRTDLAILVIDGSAAEAHALVPADKALLEAFREREIPYLVVYNKEDLQETTPSPGEDFPAPLHVSALTGDGIPELKERIAASLAEATGAQRTLVADLLHPGDQIILVIPLDESAPKGRLILPQQQVLREALEAGGIVACCRPPELARTIQTMSAPALVITDSQVFREVAAIIPAEIPLTSFSILMARYKGFLDTALQGIHAIDSLRDGDRILIAEGCTHHRQCNDIGTVKIPRWLREHSQAGFVYETVSGRDFPEDLHSYRLVIHCGGCMLTEREIRTRAKRSIAQGVPFLNYGLLIAHMNGILQRSIAPLGRTISTERNDKYDR